MRFICLLPFFAAAATLSAADPNGPTVSQLEAFERFAKQSGSRVVWSNEVRRIETDQAQAVITAVTVEDRTSPPRRMRGVRVDLTGAELKDQVYIPEEYVQRMADATGRDFDRHGAVSQPAIRKLHLPWLGSFSACRPGRRPLLLRLAMPNG